MLICLTFSAWVVVENPLSNTSTHARTPTHTDTQTHTLPQKDCECLPVPAV